MIYNHPPFHVLFHVLVLIALTGCTANRDYDRPSLIHAPPTGRTELISYRKLKRADFRASTRPLPLSNATVAAVCAQIVPAPAVRFHVRPTSILHDVPEISHVTMFNPGFRGVVNPRCSWWKAGQHSVAGILEHEQVHFAIVELHARGLNWRIAENMRQGTFSSGVPMVVIRDLLQEATQKTLEMHRRFDEEMFHQSTLSKAWLAKLEAALRRTARYAR